MASIKDSKSYADLLFQALEDLKVRYHEVVAHLNLALDLEDLPYEFRDFGGSVQFKFDCTETHLKDIGIMSNIIKRLYVVCIMSTEKAHVRSEWHTRVELAYEHHGGGRNGKTMFQFWYDKEGVVAGLRDEEGLTFTVPVVD
ncbi:MAG: hypothetical protein ACRDBG_23505 [Waterburya sp.]